MKKRTVFNLMLGCILLFSMLSILIKTTNAIDQNKQGCIDPYNCFRGVTWDIWQEGQYSHTKSSNSGNSFYYLLASSRGWDWNGSSWYLHTSSYKEKWWGTQTADTFISEWQGRAITKHSAQKYSGGNWGYLYTSEQNGWDAYSCWLNANNC